MGISLGSSSKKPYVGSKEVKEAYVGSQLVYRATPPYVYEFLGAENDYYISDKVELTSKVSITKFRGIYRLAATILAQLWIREVRGTTFAFQAYYASSSIPAKILITQYSGNSSIKQDTITIRATGDFTLYSLALLSNATQIKIQFQSAESGKTLYLDSVRYE